MGIDKVGIDEVGRYPPEKSCAQGLILVQFGVDNNCN